jgi:DNA polymerase-3 subunit delta'
MTHPWLKDVEAEFVERLNGGRLAHALLLAGPSECGKTALATSFMASVLCLENTYPACGQCRSCQLAASGAHPDGHVVTFEEHPKTGDLRKELVIDQVRRLSASLFLTNTISHRKSALVYPVEAMNRHTANALLKTLEEPPGDTVMILVSHDPARLPATIRSRCQKLDVRLPGTRASLDWLQEQAGDDARNEAEMALEAAAGSPLRALRMLRDGGVDTYLLLNETLDKLRSGTATTAEAMGGLGNVDLDRLWAWLSLRSAAETRAEARRGANTRMLSILQQEADRNRGLARTPVRKDLLLQDWLIQWSRLNR